MVNFQNLQSTLQRIADIQARFESPALSNLSTASTNASSNNTFGQILSQTQSNANPLPSNQLDQLIQNQADEQGVDANLLKAVIQNESGFNPNAVSPVGAQGLMQLMPGTAHSLGVQNSFDPSQNIQGGARYLKGLLQKYHQSLPLTLAAYNAGPAAVDHYGNVPPYAETTHYVQKVLQSYQAYQNASGG